MVLSNPQLGVDNGIAGDMNPLCRHLLGQQAVTRTRRRRQVQLSDASNHLAQPLFRERAIETIGSQSRLYMGNRHLMIEAGQRTEEGTLGITLHDHHVPGLLLHQPFQLGPAALAEFKEARALTYQRPVWPDTETVEQLGRHAVMLPGMHPLHIRPG